MREISRNTFAAFLNRPLLLRLGALGALVCVYLAGSWVPLRVNLAEAAALVLDLLGLSAGVTLQGDSVYLAVGASRIAITRACTYLDLALILMVFTWRFGAPLGANIVRSAGVAGAVMVMNLARLVVAIAAHAGGVAWGPAHDLPDTGLYHAAIAAAVMLCARRDWRMLEAQRAACAPHG
ncbi:MAG: hypothetical protein Q8R92_12280 [Deltaproteobacteria bacterium]|nr:hypothetical protein [Deltaproteobacteria bacterium]